MSASIIERLSIRALLGCTFGVAALGGSSAAQTVTVDFELAGATCAFSGTGPLREEFAHLGVHFFGPTPPDGGAVLHQCSGFGLTAHSGTDFLAFNSSATMLSGGIPKGPEEISFDQRIAQASIWAGGAFATTVRLDAFDGNVLVASDSVQALAWSPLRVASPIGFTRLVVTSSSPFFVLDDLSFDPASVATYCTAKLNSLGCLPAIGSSGAQSASAGSGFVITCANVLSQNMGLLLIGTSGRASAPFQGGTLCMQSPLKRTPAVNAGGNPPPRDCSGVYSLDMNRYAQGGPLAALTQVGTIVNCQWWGRDPGYVAPNDTTLSDALEYTVRP